MKSGVSRATWFLVLSIVSCHLASAAVPSFITTIQTPIGADPLSVAAADFNKDGKKDLVAAVCNESCDLEVFLGNGDGTFGSPQSLGQPASAVQVGDFNNDGNMDIVFTYCIYYCSNQLAGIFLGNGDGTFRFNGFFAIANSTANSFYMTAADLNGDGNLDIIAINYPEPVGQGVVGSVSLVFGDGQGGFSNPVSYTVGYQPSAIAIGDFNNDGIVDFAVVNIGIPVEGGEPVPGSVMIFLGTGGGNFKRGVTIPYKNLAPWSIASGDFNGDGKLDLAVLEVTDDLYPPGYVQIYLGNGDGSFTRGARYSANYSEVGYQGQISAADLNGDGRLDLVVLDNNHSSTALFFGNGDGTFAPPIEYLAGWATSTLLLADVNGDGRLDFIIAGGGPNGATLGVQLANSNGTYKAAPDYTSAGGANFATGDLNGDGNLDILTAGFSGLAVLLGNGDGTFKQPILYSAGEYLSAVAVGDFNNDGILDVAAGNPNGTGSVKIYLGNGDGTLRFFNNCDCGGQPSAIAVADFNEDGNLDLAVTDLSANTVTIDFGDGRGHFRIGAVFPVGLFPLLATPGEIIHKGGNDTHKGGNDLVVVNCGTQLIGGKCPPNPNGSVSVLLNQGNGLFVQVPNLGLAQPPISVAVGDYNQDGNADLAVLESTEFGSALYILLGNGDGTFQQPQPVQVNTDYEATAVLATDFNGDGKLDLMIIDDPYLIVLLGNGDGTFQPSVDFFVGVVLGGIVGDFNNDGAPDVVTGLFADVFLNAAGTKISFEASPSPAAPDTAVKLTARISPGYNGVGIPLPTGTVSFEDLSIFPVTTLATAQLTSGIAVAMVTDLGPGEHALQPVYSGDSNFNRHIGSPVVETITSGVNRGPSGGGATAVEALPILGGFGLSTKAGVAESQSAASNLGRSDIGPRPLIGNTQVLLPSLGPPIVPGLGIVLSGSNLSGFAGLNSFDSRSVGGNPDVEPPDQGLAVNDTQILEAVNDAVVLYDKSGNILSGPASLNSFFGLPSPTPIEPGGTYGPFLSDPRLLYDSDTQRWFVTAIEVLTDPANGNLEPHANVLIAVSTSSDAGKPFKIFKVDVTDPGFGTCPCLGDHPNIATNHDGLFISTNQYSFVDQSFQTALVLALDKYRLAQGIAPPVVGFQDLSAYSANAFALAPAQSAPGDASANGTEYFLSSADQISPGNQGGTENTVTVWALGNTASLSSASSVLTLQSITLTGETYAQPVAASQKHGKTPLRDFLTKTYGKEPFEKLDQDDDRFQAVVLAQGKLFGVLSTSVFPASGGQASGVAWFSITPTTTSLGTLSAQISNQGYVSLDQGDLLYPAVAVNLQGQGAITFSMSGSTLLPGVGYVPIENGQVGSSIASATMGFSPEDGFTGYLHYGGNGTARWGDYSAATVDPGGDIWFASEYIPGIARTELANWGTFIATLKTH